MSLKLNVLLGKVEHLAGSWKSSLKDYIQFFSKNQGSFKGIKKTYTAKEGTIDLPNEREFKAVSTTVGEKLAWFIDTNQDYLDGLFTVEATNASGRARAALVVEDMIIGEFSSLELLRLVSILESEDLENMYKNLPVRSDSENWSETDNDQYEGRTGIFEQAVNRGTKKSLMKETYILKDPNVDPSKENSRYTPVTATKDTIIDLGDYTIQHFSGETSHRERAEILRRRTKLLVAAKEALKKANECEIEPSDLTAEKLFSYLHTGKI